MTKPTQTPRTDAALCAHQGTPELFIKASLGRELEHDLATAAQRIEELEKASKERLDVLHWLAPKIRDELRDSPTFLHAISTDAGKEYCHRDENLTDEVADENAILREKIAELEKQLKLLCADWASDYFHLQRLCRLAGCSELAVEGDSHGVPGIEDLADSLVAALSPSPPDVEKVRVEICPQCGSSTVQPRDSEDYCEDCGWPEENRTDDAPPVQTEEKPWTPKFKPGDLVTLIAGTGSIPPRTGRVLHIDPPGTYNEKEAGYEVEEVGWAYEKNLIPAQPEEKPATVPLAVAEKLLQELQNIADAKPTPPEKEEKV